MHNEIVYNDTKDKQGGDPNKSLSDKNDEEDVQFKKGKIKDDFTVSNPRAEPAPAKNGKPLNLMNGSPRGSRKSLTKAIDGKNTPEHVIVNRKTDAVVKLESNFMY